MIAEIGDPEVEVGSVMEVFVSDNGPGSPGRRPVGSPVGSPVGKIPPSRLEAPPSKLLTKPCGEAVGRPDGAIGGSPVGKDGRLAGMLGLPGRTGGVGMLPRILGSPPAIGGTATDGAPAAGRPPGMVGIPG